MAPRRIDMVAARRSTLIVWSDAMYESTTGSLGFVAFDPDTIKGIPCSGSHAKCEVPSTLQSLDPFYARQLVGTIRRKALKARGAQAQGYFDCYAKTLLEVEQGWMVGPKSMTEMDAIFPGGWHPSERFAQYRYDGAPCRPCDNFRTSGINDFNSYHEKIVCENAAFPARGA